MTHVVVVLTKTEEPKKNWKLINAKGKTEWEVNLYHLVVKDGKINNKDVWAYEAQKRWLYKSTSFASREYMFPIDVVNEDNVDKIRKEVPLPHPGDGNRDCISSADEFITKLKAKLEVEQVASSSSSSLSSEYSYDSKILD